MLGVSSLKATLGIRGFSYNLGILWVIFMLLGLGGAIWIYVEGRMWLLVWIGLCGNVWGILEVTAEMWV